MVKLARNDDHDNYRYSGYGTGFNACESFLLFNGSGFGKNVIIFGADMISSGHTDNKKKDILILGKSTTQGLDHTTLLQKRIFHNI